MSDGERCLAFINATRIEIYLEFQLETLFFCIENKILIENAKKFRIIFIFVHPVLWIGNSRPFLGQFDFRMTHNTVIERQSSKWVV